MIYFYLSQYPTFVNLQMTVLCVAVIRILQVHFRIQNAILKIFKLVQNKVFERQSCKISTYDFQRNVYEKSQEELRSFSDDISVHEKRLHILKKICVKWSALSHLTVGQAYYLIYTCLLTLACSNYVSDRSNDYSKSK